MSQKRILIPAGQSIPLTTKGDKLTFDTSLQRLGVGADGETLIADSAEATGLRWGALASSITNFLELIDTPISYSGASLQNLRVNVGETGVEFVDNTFQNLIDKDRVPQEATTVASATGVVVLDMSKSVQDITLTGNVTGITFSNEPTVGDRVSALLNVYQDGTGGYGMDWTGSGVYAEDGKVAADFEPLSTANALTQYWLNWTGTKWIITLIKVSTTAL
jgi:hypothetical protein